MALWNTWTAGGVLAPAMPVEVIVGDIADRRAAGRQRRNVYAIEGAQSTPCMPWKIGGNETGLPVFLSGGDIAGSSRAESGAGAVRAFPPRPSRR